MGHSDSSLLLLVLWVVIIAAVMGWIIEPAKWLFGVVGSIGFLAIMLAIAFGAWGFVRHEVLKDKTTQTSGAPLTQSASSAGNSSLIYLAGRDLTVVQAPAAMPQNSGWGGLAVAQLANRMQPFHGVYVRVEDEAGAQSADFAEQLRATLRIAGLQAPSGSVIIDPDRFQFLGIKVFVQDRPVAPDDRAAAAADVLIDELGMQNFRVNRFPPEPNHGTPNFIKIRIGRLP